MFILISCDISYVCCTDTNECEEGTHDCGERQECSNTVGGFDCLCADGYVTSDNGSCLLPGMYVTVCVYVCVCVCVCVHVCSCVFGSCLLPGT